jgi:hypothetical protein
MTYDQIPQGKPGFEREAFDGILLRAVREGLLPCTSVELGRLEQVLLARHGVIKYGRLRYLHTEEFAADILTMLGQPGGDPFGGLHCLPPTIL